MSTNLNPEQLLTLSDDEDLSDTVTIPRLTEKRGILSKWTNYLQGWQNRYVVLSDGTLSYFKSQEDTRYGCRGSISLQQAIVTVHEYDELRFDVKLGNYAFYFRAENVEEKQIWLEGLEQSRIHLSESGYTSENSSIRRHGSILSLNSQVSTNSICSRKSICTIKERHQELETYRDVTIKQLDTIHKYLSIIMESIENTSKSTDQHDVEHSISGEEMLKQDQDFNVVTDQKVTSGSLSELQSRLTNVHSYPIVSQVGGTQTSLMGFRGHRRTESDSITLVHGSKSSNYNITRSRSGSVLTQWSTPVEENESVLRQLKEETVTFKATTAAFLIHMCQCIESVRIREDKMRQRIEQEIEKRKQAEATAEAVLMTLTAHTPHQSYEPHEDTSNNDCDKSHGHWRLPTSEEEFFDALETNTAIAAVALDNKSVENLIIEITTNEEQSEFDIEEVPFDTYDSKHRLSDIVKEKVCKYSCYAFERVEDNSLWSLVHEDGEMKVFRRELEENSIVMDPLRATFLAKGITARELCKIFFHKETRMSWENTIESMQTLEDLDPWTTIYKHMHKRIWPSTQRQTIFCSNICRLTNVEQPENYIGDTYFVINFSVDHPDAPEVSKYIRVRINISLTCQTYSNSAIDALQIKTLSRDDINCRMIYTADVHPGGWVPPAVVRNIGKRELTKFMKKISHFCYKHNLSNPIKY